MEPRVNGMSEEQKREKNREGTFALMLISAIKSRPHTQVKSRARHCDPSGNLSHRIETTSSGQLVYARQNIQLVVISSLIRFVYILNAQSVARQFTGVSHDIEYLASSGITTDQIFLCILDFKRVVNSQIVFQSQP